MQILNFLLVVILQNLKHIKHVQLESKLTNSNRVQTSFTHESADNFALISQRSIFHI